MHSIRKIIFILIRHQQLQLVEVAELGPDAGATLTDLVSPTIPNHCLTCEHRLLTPSTPAAAIVEGGTMWGRHLSKCLCQ
jgi:hypothetical protein